MRKIQIVADSSADLMTLDGVEFSTASLKIVTSDREFLDDEALDAGEMTEYLDKYKGKSHTSCPNTNDWISAFGEAEEVFCITITSGLSGSYNSACIAKKAYEEMYPERRVYVIDSLSTGPEMILIIEKLRELINADTSFEEIIAKINEYKKNTGLLFMLKSMNNLANNGRVSKISAKIAGVMNIRVVGKASDVGTLEPLDKPRGEKMTLLKMKDRLLSLGYKGGKLRITHCLNAESAETLCKMMLEIYPTADITIGKCRGLCSFYAERGGMLVGFEKSGA